MEDEASSMGPMAGKSDGEVLDLIIGPVYASAWLDFPSKFKFIGFEICTDDIMTMTERKRYNFFDFIKSIGGLMKFGMAVCGLFVKRFGQARINSLMAHEFYKWDIPDSFKNKDSK